MLCYALGDFGLYSFVDRLCNVMYTAASFSDLPPRGGGVRRSIWNFKDSLRHSHRRACKIRGTHWHKGPRGNSTTAGCTHALTGRQECVFTTLSESDVYSMALPTFECNSLRARAHPVIHSNHSGK